MYKITKTITLTVASIRDFMRNWKSILLLIFLPLLLIGSFFVSFSAEGLQKLPIGIIDNPYLDVKEISSYLSQVLITNEFSNLDDCLTDLKAYNQYVCIEITKEDIAYQVNAHYDNTQTLVVWGIINHIRTTIDWIKKQKTKEVASEILEQAESGPYYINEIRSEVNNLNSNFDNYIYGIESSVTKIENNKNSIGSNLQNIRSSKQTYHPKLLNSISSIESIANSLIREGAPFSNYGYEIKSKTNQLRSDLVSYDNELESSLNAISLQPIEESISNLNTVKSGLRMNNRGAANEIESNLNSLEYYLGEIGKIDPDAIADPIKLKLTPTYLPTLSPEILEKYKGKERDISTLIKGENLLSFQVVFPKILLLIVMFISLLTSSFICLNYLKSPANIRIKTMKHMFFPSFLSIYISSLLITIIPILCVILLGNFLFLLPFFENILIISLIIFISASIYILIGMALSYLIKKKSLTLLISIFVLIFLLFFSGFILPIERMGRIPAKIAASFPGNVASDALNKLLFYNQPLSSLKGAIILLAVTLAGMLIITLIIKRLRKQ